MSNILIIIGVITLLLYVIGINIYLYKKTKSLENHMKSQSIRPLMVLMLLLLFVCSALLAISGLLTLVFYSAVILLGSHQILTNHKHLNLNKVLIALILGGLIFLTMAHTSPTFVVLNVFSTFIAALAGMALIEQHGFITFNPNRQKWLKGLLIGALIALPPAVLNGQATYDDSHIQTIYHSLLAIKPALHEELLVRYFLMTYILTKRTPVLIANLAVSIPFAMLHGFNPVGIVIIIVMFSLPLGYIYVRHGIEAAVSAHFVTDFIRYLMPFL